MIYPRLLQAQIEERLFKGKIIVIYGSRQVGKTTLVNEICNKYNGYVLNGDQPEVKAGLTNKNSHELKSYIGDHKLVVIDEAQRIENIGLTLKLLIDNYPEMQIIATGSSSFDLANKIREPLTGRAWIYNLYPLSFNEISPYFPGTPISVAERMMRFGSFPDVWDSSDDDASNKLATLGTDFLFKDILEYQQLKKSTLLLDLLKALALQVGSEVSYTGLADLLRTNPATIEKYIFLLEQVFVIYRLPMLRRNPRTEVGKLRKIYFYDLGLRNTLISNHNPLDIRADKGGLWENFCVSERIKRNSLADQRPNQYFWRSYSQREVDLVEERAGQMHAYEFKYSTARLKQPKEFKDLYPGSTYEQISLENFPTFLGPT